MKLIDILTGTILGPIRDAYIARQEAKSKQAQLDSVLQQKKLDAMATAASAEIALSIAQVNTAGWKDDWFTYLFSVPLVLSFFPTLVPAVQTAFNVLDTMPVWYKVYLGSAVAASFGLHTVDRMWTWWHS